MGKLKVTTDKELELRKKAEESIHAILASYQETTGLRVDKVQVSRGDERMPSQFSVVLQPSDPTAL